MTSGPPLISPIVSTQWLADHLGADKLVILDATVNAASAPHSGYVSGHEQFVLNGHIPGAQFADLLDEFSDPEGRFPFTKPGQAQFEAAASSIGIDNQTTVIVYDSSVGQWASRIWWLFRTWGYDNVAVLDGGFTKWKAEGRLSEIGHIPGNPASFTAVERPELWADKELVGQILTGEVAAGLVCGSPPKDFSGEDPGRGRAGHIPGSINVPAGRLVDRGSNALLGDDELREKFAPVLDGERIVIYCGGGIAATADALALTLLGHNNIAVYDGSLNEWAADPELELVVGA
ncbi:MAG: thiosulfate/3-mercaptopyruvate sulfurtransferase [Microbacteriaceae bacterium]|jgi:thiosulfate/3-mercaptopyruvate sulfurtransferase|nr:thiosulfate/3-mercaptopyruvate sulfurtransferase [Microbacteriaceae bacterium]